MAGHYFPKLCFNTVCMCMSACMSTYVYVFNNVSEKVQSQMQGRPNFHRQPAENGKNETKHSLPAFPGEGSKCQASKTA